MGSHAAEARTPSIMVSPNSIKYNETKEIKITGVGFTPGSMVIVGVIGLGQYKGVVGAEDLWFGLARVNQDRTFDITVSLENNLWKIEGLSGKHSVAAKNEFDERANAPLIIE